MNRITLQVNLGGLIMKNPVTVASGTFASGREYSDLWQHSKPPVCHSERSEESSQAPANQDGRGTENHSTQFNQEFSETYPASSAILPLDSSVAALPLNDKPLSILGAVTTKGVSLKPWPGNPGTRIAETASGMLNSIGLQNPGVEAFCSRDLQWLAKQEVPIIVNVSGHSIEEYAEVIARLEEEPSVSAYEVNISCPNVASGGMSFGTSSQAAAAVTAACREAAASSRPLIVKLTPNVTDITEIARACEDAGASALSLINTVAGMSVNLKRRCAVFSRTVAGLSGPAIKPVALYAVHRVYQAVQIPLLGIGGIATPEDALEFILAGACAIATGTANFTDPLAAPRIIEGMVAWCEHNNVADINELIGALT